MLESDLAYLAGFMDGEGSFIINKREHIGYKGKRYVGFSAHMEVTNTNPDVLDWISATFNVKAKKYVQQLPGNRKPAWRVRVGYKEAKPLAEKFGQFLIVKKAHLPIFLKYGTATKDEKNSLWEQMRVLNKRGIL